MINILVAADPNGVIGKGNVIPWHISEDLKLFKQRTFNSCVVMGRKTWDSLPKKPLSGRINYIISRYAQKFDGAIWCKSLEEAIEKSILDDKDIYIIGGEQIYTLALQTKVVDRIILSRVKQTYEGDHYFHIPDDWQQVHCEPYSEFDVLYFEH